MRIGKGDTEKCSTRRFRMITSSENLKSIPELLEFRSRLEIDNPSGKSLSIL